VFKSLDPNTGRPDIDETRKPGTGKTAEFCPSLWGGKDWPPVAFSPQTRLLYIPANENLCHELTGEVPKYVVGERYMGVAKNVMKMVAGANNRVDAIVAAAPAAVQAAAGATTSIPVIAIDLESDPVASGFVRSLARPGGNVTGVFLDFPDFSAKCLQLLIETVPTLSGVGLLWDPSTGVLQLKAVEAAAQAFGISAQVFEARRAADIAEAFYALDRSRFQGLLLLSSPLIAGNPQLIADLAIRRNLPTISLFPEIARAGGLIGYGPVIQDLFRQVGGMARKVLQGAKVAELPAERPTRFQLVANLKTAKLIGVTLPASILLRADEVIE